MYLLDTDTLSLYLHHAAQHPHLVARVRATPPMDLGVSVITAEEVLRGALDLIRRDQRTPRVVERYAFFGRLLQSLNLFRLLPYDQAAEAHFAAMPPEVKRRGTQDCRIAAVALAHDCIVITRNSRHFEVMLPGRHENWTISG